jgi:hypothetical protein
LATENGDSARHWRILPQHLPEDASPQQERACTAIGMSASWLQLISLARNSDRISKPPTGAIRLSLKAAPEIWYGSGSMKTTSSESASDSAIGSKSGLRNVLEDGALTGIVGAVMVSLIFLALDFASGRPFFTPSLLGTAIFRGEFLSDLSEPDPAMVFAYTGLHGIAFLLVGFLLAALFREFEQHPKIGLELLVALLVFEGLLMGAEVTVFPSLVGELGAWAVAIANIASLIAMFTFLAYRHPQAIKALRESE